MNNLIKIISILSVSILSIGLYFFFIGTVPDKPISGRGSKIGHTNQYDIGGSFTLTDQDGNKFSSEELKGKISLIYFGFVRCPDICPTTLTKLSKVVNELEKRYNIKVTPVFITVDSERDTPKLLKEFLSDYKTDFIGLLGNKEEIKDIEQKYKATHSIAESTKDGTDNYLIDHTSLVYLLDKNGKYVKHFYRDTTKDEIIDFIIKNKNLL
jgi:protein SCO1/2